MPVIWFSLSAGACRRSIAVKRKVIHHGDGPARACVLRVKLDISQAPVWLLDPAQARSQELQLTLEAVIAIKLVALALIWFRIHK